MNTFEIQFHNFFICYQLKPLLGTIKPFFIFFLDEVIVVDSSSSENEGILFFHITVKGFDGDVQSK